MCGGLALKTQARLSVSKHPGNYLLQEMKHWHFIGDTKTRRVSSGIVDSQGVLFSKLGPAPAIPLQQYLYFCSATVRGEDVVG